MATPRDIRRLAFQTLFQLDARGESDAESIRATIEAAANDDREEFSSGELEKAFTLAAEAYQNRRAADEAVALLAPGWPAHRQPAVDRAIIRLAHYEMTSGRTGPKVAVNEAVELAKLYSTDKSPGFVNGVLDKILKQVLATSPAADSPDSPPVP